MNDVNAMQRDFRVFADPATDFSVQETDDLLRVRLIRDGDDREYVVDRSSGRVTAKSANARKYASIAALLASEEFADVRAFRATQRRMLATKLTAQYIEPEGQLQTSDGISDLSLASFRSALTDRVADTLSILLLDGPAGIGKTSLIERMVYERSDPAASAPPLLHVTSSGSRLTDLSKALAHAAQVLRSKITFDQVPILIRHNVLQVAIDGFDELVDPDGYRDAWSALREFLSEVGVGGPILLAGRDTFFDQQRFEKTLAHRMPNLSLVGARLHPSSPAAARRYLQSCGWSKEDLKSADATQWLRPGSYRLRPFFLAQIKDSRGWAELNASHGSPQAFLVNRFVDREAELISRMIALPVETATAALWEFYGLIVEDMARLEMDAVDDGYLALACEAAFSSAVTGDDLSKLVHKAASFGLLEADGRERLRQFPHSELQNQFLARRILANLDASAVIASFLRRAVVGMALAEAFGDVFGTLEAPVAARLQQKLKALLSDEMFADRLMSNVVTLLLATLTRGDLSDPLEIVAAIANEARIFDTLSPARLREVELTRLDARGADCSAVEFIDCRVATLIVDETTKFGSTRPGVATSLQLETEGALQTIREPNQISRWLDAHTTKPLTVSRDAEQLPFVSYFERVCRKFMRQHQIRDSERDDASFLLRDSRWRSLQPLLGERLITEQRTAGGANDAFYRLLRPEDLLRPPAGDVESARIRASVVARASELSSDE